MNCADIQKSLIAFEDDVIPADLQRHLDGCETCRKQYAQLQGVRKLISLKQYERPDPWFEQRMAAKINAALDARDEQTAGERAWEAFTGGRIPALRYVMALLLVALVGINVYFYSQGPAAQTAAPVQAPAPQPVAVAEVPAPPPAITNFQVVPVRPAEALIADAFSNRGPGRVEYGPLHSVPVNFEY